MDYWQGFTKKKDKEMKWIDINLPWWNGHEDSFTERELNEPGTLIDIGDEQILIGDTNVMGGACGCCQVINDSVIIKRYKIVWRK